MKTNKLFLTLLISLLIFSSFGAYAEELSSENSASPFIDVIVNSELNSSSDAVNPDSPTTSVVFASGSSSPYAFSRLQKDDTVMVEDDGAVYFYRDGDKYNTKMYHILDFTAMTGKVVLDWAGRTTTTGVQYRTFYAVNSSSVSNSTGASLRSGGGPTVMTRWTLVFDLDNDTISYYENGMPASPGTEFSVAGELTGFALLHYLQGAESASKMGGVDYVRIYNIPGDEPVIIEDNASTELTKAVIRFGLPVTEESVEISGDNVEAFEKCHDMINAYTVSLKNLNFEQEYSINVTAELIDGTFEEKTLTAKTRSARSDVKIAGIYDGAYSSDAEPLDSLSDIVVSAALKAENELADNLNLYIGFGVYDANGSMVAYSGKDVIIPGKSQEQILEIPLDLCEISNIDTCSYSIFIWDSLEAMNPYGTKNQTFEGFLADVSADVNFLQKTLTVTLAGYDDTCVDTPVTVRVISENNDEAYLNEIYITKAESTSVVIPVDESGMYTVYVNSPLLAQMHKSEYRILQDSDADDILKSINAASDGNEIYALIESNGLDEIFDFAPYNTLKATGDDACKGVCELVCHAKSKDEFFTMSDFYKAVYEASIVYSFESGMTDEILAGYVEEYDDIIGFSEYNAYKIFSDSTPEFKSAVIKRAANENVTNTENLTMSLGAAVVNELIHRAESYLQINDYISDNNDLLKFELSDYKSVKSDVCRQLVNENFETLGELTEAFEEAVEDALNKKDSSGKKGSSGGGGGGKASGGLIVAENPPVVKEQTTTPVPPVTDTQKPKEYFSDLAGFEWARVYIDSMYEKGIVSGKSTGIFAPGDMITRAEFTKLISIAFDIPEAEYDGFSDSTPSDWYYTYVSGAYKKGIINGTGNGLFGSENPITRQDAAVILSRLTVKTNSGDKAVFTDSERISDYASDAVALLAGLKIINGNEAGEFMPLENLNRAEASKIIYLLMETEGR